MVRPAGLDMIETGVFWRGTNHGGDVALAAAWRLSHAATLLDSRHWQVPGKLEEIDRDLNWRQREVRRNRGEHPLRFKRVST